MIENSRDRDADDVARIFLEIVASTAGHSTNVIEAAFAMSLTLVGEQQGLGGADLVDWIDTIATAASLAAERETEDEQSAPRARLVLN